MNRRARQLGAALVMVIWALAVIGAVVAAYFARGLVEAGASQEARETAGGRSLAQAGLACFLRRFLADEDELDDPGARWLLAGPGALPSQIGGEVTVRVFDCGSRINLNLADRTSLEILFDGQREAPVETILDWRDADDKPRPAGAEKDYYQGLDPPLVPANGFFDCPEEVWLVKGVEKHRRVIEDETTIYGRANPNLIAPEILALVLAAAGVEDWKVEGLVEEFAAKQTAAVKAGKVPFTGPEDLRAGDMARWTGETVDLLAPYLTFKGQVNPNFASARALRIALAQLGMKPEKVTAILKAREEAGPFKDLAEFAALLAKDEPKLRKDWVGQIFTLQTTLAGMDAVGRTKYGTPYRITAVVERYHPANEGHRWQGRSLYWREWPNQDYPAPAGEPPADGRNGG